MSDVRKDINKSVEDVDSRDIFDKIIDHPVAATLGTAAGVFSVSPVVRRMARRAMKIHKMNGNHEEYEYAKKIANGELEAPISMKMMAGAGGAYWATEGADALNPKHGRYGPKK